MKLVFDKMKGEPSYAAGARYIEEMIRSGQLMNGDKLPSIREFADDNDMSTATAQRIYSEIEQKGLITTIQGSGSLVTFNEDVVLDDGINKVTVFWSYAHKDDLNSKGAVLTLLEAIKAEYELQTGEDLTVFVDKDGIEWGANWKNAINEALLNTVIFIPILTPTYLKRPSCLGELRNAVSVFREKKIAYGIFPIRFTNVDAALKNFPDDDLANTLSETQASNFYEIRTRDPESSVYQDYVATLVAKLVEVDQWLCEGHLNLVKQASETLQETQDGFLDRLAALEAEGENQARILNSMTENMAAIGLLAQEKTIELKESDAKNKGIAAKLIITRSMAKELGPLADEFYANCREFTQSVETMGAGVSAYVEICQYYGGERSFDFENAVSSLIDNTNVAFSECRDFGNSVSVIGKMSRDLRAPAHRIQKSLDLFCSTQSQFSKWVEELKHLDSVE